MKNVSTLKANKIDSPKTPGGISKSLLTPCRRIGLSRNWKKGGPSPFISPLSGTGESKQEVQTKRKIEDVDLEKSNSDSASNDVNTTPRSVHIPRRKRSKILSVDPEPLSPVIAGNELEQNTTKNTAVENVPTEVIHNYSALAVTPVLKCKSKINNLESSEELAVQNTLVENPSKEAPNEEISVVTPIIKSRSKKFTPPLATNTKQEYESHMKINPENVSKLKSRKNSAKLEKSKKSPENLTKECIVVIQKKLFKDQVLASKVEDEKLGQKSTSQTLFDSDSDDVPLCKLNKKGHEVDEVIDNVGGNQSSPTKDKVQNSQIQPRVLVLDEDNDFMETSKVKVKKLEDKTTSTSSLKKIVKNKTKENKKPVTIITKEPQPSSQSSDDDDFDFNQKRTILIRKSYDKVTKPLKAKSTGSITQKDIDELRSRIEVKKKLLLAKAMGQDTEELRQLIKKWQKGCQDALSELMEMMRSKFPDKQNMEFAEMLQTLKIPSNLVGYDEENDCFNTPDDASIVLAKFNDL